MAILAENRVVRPHYLFRHRPRIEFIQYGTFEINEVGRLVTTVGETSARGVRMWHLSLPYDQFMQFRDILQELSSARYGTRRAPYEIQYARTKAFLRQFRVQNDDLPLAV